MKFCYVDESGMGSEPFLVMAAVVVDAQRMHVTKQVWGELLSILSKETGRIIKEFHTKDFYAGNGPWRGIEGNRRAEILSVLLNWWRARRHNVTFSGIDKAKHSELLKNCKLLSGCESPWSTVALHIILTVQKYHQPLEKNKGHTMLLFDREQGEQTALSKIVANPPGWTDEYYNRDKSQMQLDQIIDVPFFGDSEEVLLIQFADLIAYVLRRYIEIEEGKTDEQYKGERTRLKNWTDLILERCFPKASRWPKVGLTIPDKMFQELAPASLRALG